MPPKFPIPAVCLPAAQRVGHQSLNRQKQIRLKGQHAAQLKGIPKYPLAIRHVRQDVIHKMRRALRHAARIARAAHTALLAGKGNHVIVTAGFTVQADEAKSRVSASEKRAEGFLNERRESAVLRTCLAEKPVQVVSHHAVQHRFLRLMSVSLHANSNMRAACPDTASPGGGFPLPLRHVCHTP